MVNIYAVIILVALLSEYVLSLLSSVLNLRSLSTTVPAEFSGVFDETRYAASQEYTRTQTRFGLLRSTASLVLVLTFWQLGGFEWLDQTTRALGFGPIITGLLFIGASKDGFFRAFDKGTGEELWKIRLPAGGYATPATYLAGGRQFVVIAATGYGRAGIAPGDAIVAFALPAGRTD